VRCLVVPGEPALAWVDAGQIQQVLTNLVVNAIHAQPASRTVEIVVRSDGARVSISVSDDGEGMKPEVLARIFEPFFTTKPLGKGTGLGLAVAHGIVEEHGGSIEAESAPGQGTTLRVHLPTGAPP
jgi:signal transduction histidine kinase